MRGFSRPWAVAWAAVDLVPVLGGLVTFVLSAMGFGYLALYLVNGRSDRYDPQRDRDEKRVGGSDVGPRDDEEPDRFRNVAALDAERRVDATRDDDDDSPPRR